MKFLFIILSSILFSISCSNAQTEIRDKKMSKDTSQRPTGMTHQAVLLNFGSEDEPIMVWADYAGNFRKDGKKYSHIYAVRYYYVKAEMNDTLYYENMGLRNRSNQFDFKNSTILNYPGEATIKVSKGVNEVLLFNAIESDDFAREHRGIVFKRMPTISLNNGNYVGDVELEFSLNDIGNRFFEMTLNDGSRVKYKLSGECKEKNPLCSFLNRQDGRIYFVDRDCYLELVNNGDKRIFQGLR